jgi:hypothetical protein
VLIIFRSFFLWISLPVVEIPADLNPPAQSPLSALALGGKFARYRLAGGTMPFILKYSTS